VPRPGVEWTSALPPTVANRRWIERYARVEALANRRGVDLTALDLAGKDELWNAVKHGDDA